MHRQSVAAYAVGDLRRQELLAEAALFRLVASALQPHVKRKGAMFSPEHLEAVVQRRVGEALAGQNMLQRTPAREPQPAPVLARMAAAVRAIACGRRCLAEPRPP